MPEQYPRTTVFGTEERTLFCPTRGREYHLSVALPESYSTSTQAYPVIYLLDGDLFFGMAAGLTPIVCVGELSEERKAGRTQAIVQEQFDGSLAGLSAEQAGKIIIAYEPVWAIGTGVVATPEQAEEVHSDLRRLLESRYNPAVANAVRIQYGGSVTAENAKSLLSQSNIDGALVGGASLKVESFLGILAAAK